MPLGDKSNSSQSLSDKCDRLWSRLQLLRFKYQMIEQRITYALICLVCTYLFSYLSYARWKLNSEIAVLRNAHLKIAKLGKVR